MSAPPEAFQLPERPPGSAHLTYTVGAITAVGGVAGYVKGRSPRSLAAGLLFGAGFGYAGHLIGTQPERGFRFATTVSGLLTGVMAHRLYSTGKVMPAGALAAVGAAATAYHASKWAEYW